MPTATDTALARVEQSHRPPQNFGSFLELVKPRLAEVLPGHVNAETLIRVVQTFGNQNEKLLKCTESSLLTSLMLCSQLGLPPNTPQGFAWLIPFQNRRQGVMECKVLFGKNGLTQLVRNSGEIARMNSGVVYRHEVERGLFNITSEPPALTHTPDVLAKDSDYADKQVVAAWALVITKSGERIQRMLRLDQILKRRDNSQAVQSAKRYNNRTPWDDWFPEMCGKTAIRQLMTAAEVPKSTDLMTALEGDIDAPVYDEVRTIATQADGFRQQAAAALPPVIDAPALPAAPEPDPEPEQTPAKAAQAPDTAKKTKAKAAGPKKATKPQVARLWKRWAKITDCDPAAPAAVDKESFKGFVGARIGEEKAGDSSTWTADECKAIGKGLDELRDGGAAPAQKDKEPTVTDEKTEEQPPAAEVTQESEEPAPEPAISKQDALKKLKYLRDLIGMSWDDVRELAAGECGVTARASSKWTAEECLDVIECMQASAKATAPDEATPAAEAAEEAAPPKPPSRPDSPDPNQDYDLGDPPPLDDRPPETEVDPSE